MASLGWWRPRFKTLSVLYVPSVIFHRAISLHALISWWILIEWHGLTLDFCRLNQRLFWRALDRGQSVSLRLVVTFVALVTAPSVAELIRVDTYACDFEQDASVPLIVCGVKAVKKLSCKSFPILRRVISIWCLASLCNIFFRDDVLVAVRDCLQLTRQKASFMQNMGRSVHLNQVLYVLLFAKPFKSFVNFSLFQVPPLETSAPTQASL